MSTIGPTPELDKLYKACRDIEALDGGWNGGDVVDIVTGLLTAHGYDLTPITWCEQCQETPAAAGGKLCEGCAEDDQDDEVPDMECPECGAPAGTQCAPWCVVAPAQPAG